MQPYGKIVLDLGPVKMQTNNYFGPQPLGEVRFVNLRLWTPDGRTKGYDARMWLALEDILYELRHDTFELDLQVGHNLNVHKKASISRIIWHKCGCSFPFWMQTQIEFGFK